MNYTVTGIDSARPVLTSQGARAALGPESRFGEGSLGTQELREVPRCQPSLQHRPLPRLDSLRASRHAPGGVRWTRGAMVHTRLPQSKDGGAIYLSGEAFVEVR